MGNYSYFYVWTHRETCEQYVGVTTRPIEQRFREHCKEDSNCVKLRNAIQKHGVGAFDFEYFEWVDQWDLAYIEKILVDELESLSPNGYNLRKGGGSYGSLTDEVKQKISEALSGPNNPMYGKEHTEDTKKKLSEAKSGPNHPMYGKEHTEDTKKKMSEAHKGKTLTEEHKKKISEARIGIIFSEDHKKKISEANTGKTHTEESKKKMSEAQLGEKNHMYGKEHTEESKKKMSEAHKGKTGELCSNSKKVYQYDLDGTFIRPFGSCREAGRHLGKGHKYIAACANGKQKSAYTFRWSYEHVMIL